MEITTVEQVKAIVAEAKAAAHEASIEYFNTKLGGQDQCACGFAWTGIHSYNGKKIKGNMKIGRLLAQAGIRQNWERVFEIWNPGGLGVQNIDCKEAGARAAAEVFKKHGFEAYCGSRLD